MSRIRIAGAVIGLMVFFVVEKHVLVRCPKMTRNGDTQLTVGDADGDHATYAIGERASFSASSVGYEMDAIDSGLPAQLGSRGVLSYLDSQLYAGVVQQAKCTGQCMAGPLNAYEAQGRLGHLLLIPANDQALNTMKRVKLPGGAKFHLSGNSLTYLSGQLDGHSFNGQLGNTGYFLVESIEQE